MFRKEQWIKYGEPEPASRTEMIARCAVIGGLVMTAMLLPSTPGEEVDQRHRQATEVMTRARDMATNAHQTGLPECGTLPPLVRKQYGGPARTSSYFMVMENDCVTTVREDDSEQTPIGVIGPDTRINELGCVTQDGEMRVEYHRTHDYQRVVGTVAVSEQTFGGSAGPRRDCA